MTVRNPKVETLVLTLPSISATTLCRLDAKQMQQRVDALARDLRLGIRGWAVSDRWEGVNKDRFVFLARAGNGEIGGRIELRRGEVVMSFRGKVTVRGLQGLTQEFRPNQGEIDRFIQSETEKALKQAFAERTSISTTAAIQYIAERVYAMLQKQVSQKAPAGRH